MMMPAEAAHLKISAICGNNRAAALMCKVYRSKMRETVGF